MGLHQGNMKWDNQRAQSAVEYFLLFAAVAVIALLSVSTFFNKSQEVASTVFNTSASAIMGPIVTNADLGIVPTPQGICFTAGVGCTSDQQCCVGLSCLSTTCQPNSSSGNNLLYWDVCNPGNDQCSTGLSCQDAGGTNGNRCLAAVHKVCSGTSCVQVSGVGANQCTTDVDCGAHCPAGTCVTAADCTGGLMCGGIPDPFSDCPFSCLCRPSGTVIFSPLDCNTGCCSHSCSRICPNPLLPCNYTCN
jgi:hypothetical protein